ncbi:MAG TPA: ABC transporter substrate-binding protein, partial [Caldimonas sp.]|nr:ABC transporter substrate-binding protein [Caldimonas sp.]
MQQTTTDSCAGARGIRFAGLTGRRKAEQAAFDGSADFVVGLLVPINGSAGIWGPSSIACAQLAQVEINAEGGLLDRQLRLRIIDSSDEALEVGSVTADLMRSGAIDAIVGMHTSQVRQRVLRDVARQIPYVYTPLYEGGERTPGVFALGETPEQQLQPAIEYLIERYRARRWMFIGNDYCWPRV